MVLQLTPLRKGTAIKPKLVAKPKNESKKKKKKLKERKPTKAEKNQKMLHSAMAAVSIFDRHCSTIETDLSNIGKEDVQEVRKTHLKEVYDKYNTKTIKPMEEVVHFAYWKPGAAKIKKQYRELMKLKVSKNVLQILPDVTLRLHLYREQLKKLEKQCKEEEIKRKEVEASYRKLIGGLRKQINRAENDKWENDEAENEDMKY